MMIFHHKPMGFCETIPQHPRISPGDVGVLTAVGVAAPYLHGIDQGIYSDFLVGFSLKKKNIYGTPIFLGNLHISIMYRS